MLGLTFTTKAASELRARIRQALTDAGRARRHRDPEAEDVLEPTVATYNAYAAGLLTDHGLRIGHEPDTRVITDAARYQLGARVVDRHTGEVALLSDHPKTVDPEPPRPRRGDERAPRRPGRRPPGRRRGAGRASGPPPRRSGRARTARPTSTRCEKAANAIERRGELLGLVDGYRRMKADLGLMDFSDQIELGARLADGPARGRRRRAREVQGRAARRVPGHLGRPGDRCCRGSSPAGRGSGGARGHRGRRPQPGDLRLARRVGLQHPRLRRDVPGRGRRGAVVPADGQPALRPPDPRGRQPPGRAALRRARPRSARSSPSPRRPRGSSPRGSSRPSARSWPGWPRRCARRTAARDRALVRHRRAHPRQRARRRGLRRADRGRHPGRDRRAVRAAPAARGRRGRRRPAPAQGRHRQRVAAHPAHRAALGDRAARPQAARRPGPRAGRRPRPRSRDPASIDDHLVAIADGIDPAEIAVPRRRAQRPGRGGLLRRGAGAVRAARRRAADAALPRRRAAARHRPPDRRHDRRRRRARLGGQPVAAARGATTSTCSSGPSPTSRRSTATSPWSRCWPT